MTINWIILLQTPRTQKNNVSKSKKDKGPLSEAVNTATSNKFVIKMDGNPNQTAKSLEQFIIPDSTSPALTTQSTIQTVSNVTSEGLNEGNVICGYLLTTASVSGGDLGNLVPSELVMFGPVPNLSNGGATIQNGNPSQNITIIASSSNASSKSNNV